MSDFETKFLENSIQKYLKRYRTGPYEDLIQFVDEMINFNDVIKSFSREMENKIKMLLLDLKEKRVITWDEDDEIISLLKEDYIKDNSNLINPIKRYPYWCELIGIITHPTTILDLKQFEDSLLKGNLNNLSEIRKIDEEPSYFINFKWDYQDFHIEFRIRPQHFAIENHPSYIFGKSPLYKYIKEKSLLSKMTEITERIPSLSGIYFFFSYISEIIQTIDMRYTLIIKYIQDYKYSNK